MENIKVSTAQFEHRSGDKDYNLSVIELIAEKAAMEGSGFIAFHECSVTGYTFARKLSREQLLELAEYVPEGESVSKLIQIAGKYNITILAGLFEKDNNNRLFNTYVCADKHGLITAHRKLHPFINTHLSPGDEYCVFDLRGWKCGILTCYDNNIIENVRATKLLGADVIFMPHVTMGTPSSRPGAGYFNRELWKNRGKNQHLLRSMVQKGGSGL